MRIAGLHDDFDTRHGLADFGQHGRQQIDAGSCARADAQASRYPAAMRCYGIDRMRHFFRNPPCMDEKIPPRRRRLRAPADPFDQPHAELLFQEPDMQADGRLGQPRLVGGGGKAAEIGDIHEAAHLPQIEVHHQRKPYRLYKIDNLYFGCAAMHNGAVNDHRTR